MKSLRLLDCTLRDGGHITLGNFGEETIKGVSHKLTLANVDIVELGFVWDRDYDSNYSRFYNIDRVKRILPSVKTNTKYSIMIEKQNVVQNIEPYDGSIEYIRVIFKRHLWEWAFETVQRLKDLGYKVFMNPVNCTVYTDDDYLKLIDRINEASPYAMSIVDTFGNFRLNSFIDRFKLVDNNLSMDISLGVHLHDNLGLAFAMAQQALLYANSDRNIIIDGSLLGMGRDPGNLKIEQMAEYANHFFGKNYNLYDIYDAMDDHIYPLLEKYSWGYKLPYAMSSYYDLHRTYAEFLMNQKISTKDIDIILSKIDRSKAEYYDEQYIDSLYRAFYGLEV